MLIDVVTTFHQEGMEVYGQRFIDSFAKNVDPNVRLIVYAEDCAPINPAPDRIKILNAKVELSKLNKFKATWKDVPKANGKCPFPEKRPRDHHKEFKWHAIRFANKVYAVFDAAEKSDADWVVWLDADTYVHSPISKEQFNNLLLPEHWITYVGRGKGSQTWPECGFYGLNLKHDSARIFLKEFERFYEDADNGIFTLDEWHDSYVFGHILDNMRSTHPNWYDYSSDLYLKEAKTGGGGHPFINCILGTWFDHMKGGRKNQGKSQKKDLMVNRPEDYWNEI